MEAMASDEYFNDKEYCKTLDGLSVNSDKRQSENKKHPWNLAVFKVSGE